MENCSLQVCFCVLFLHCSFPHLFVGMFLQLSCNQMDLNTLRKTALLFSQSFLKPLLVVRMIVAVEAESLEAFGPSFQMVVIPMAGG